MIEAIGALFEKWRTAAGCFVHHGYWIIGLIMLYSAMVGVSKGGSTEADRAASADELFAVFVDLRSSIKFDHATAQYEDPRFYTRAWLEDAIKSALNAAKQPDRAGLNWVQDSLLAKFSSSMSVQSVYGYKLITLRPNYAGLQMQVTDACNRPATYTTEFALEDGAWRIAHLEHDSSISGQAWFNAKLEPLKVFSNITLRDRSRYFNEGTLGTKLGLSVTNDRCSTSQ